MAVKMYKDMTFQKINTIKSNIKEFSEELQREAFLKGFDFTENDKNFFSFIGKHIVFFKYLYCDNRNMHFCRVLISDFYYFILSIINSEMRYMYVNERSIIENCLRMIMQTSIQEDHITEHLFQEMHKKHFKCSFSEKEYSLIRGEYVTACGYIHGSEILSDNLAFIFDECSNKKFKVSNRKKYYGRMEKVLKAFVKLIISENADYVNGCFHREKTIMEYLVGKGMVDLLFQILDKKS